MFHPCQILECDVENVVVSPYGKFSFRGHVSIHFSHAKYLLVVILPPPTTLNLIMGSNQIYMPIGPTREVKKFDLFGFITFLFLINYILILFLFFARLLKLSTI